MSKLRERTEGTTECALCRAKTTHYLTGGDYNHYNCSRCGRFWITGSAKATLDQRNPLTIEQRTQLLSGAGIQSEYPWIDTGSLQTLQTHAIRDLLSFPTAETVRTDIALIEDFNRRFRSQIREIEDLASRLQVKEMDLYPSLSLLNLVDTTPIESLASSLRFVDAARYLDAATLIGERLRDLDIARRLDLSTYEGLLASHDDLAEQFNSLRLQATVNLPTLTLPAASRELLAANYAVDVLTVEEEEEDESQEETRSLDDVEIGSGTIESLLQRVDADLVRPYQGIKDAMRGDSVDRARHVLVSARELWTHLLHHMAPNELVAQWAEGKDPELVRNDRPTRQARLLYICRRIDQEPLTGFVSADERAFREHFNLFHRVHQLTPELSDRQLRAIVARTESWLDFIIRIWIDE